MTRNDPEMIIDLVSLGVIRGYFLPVYQIHSFGSVSESEEYQHNIIRPTCDAEGLF